MRPFMHWCNVRIMNAYFKKALNGRFEAYTQRPNQTSNKSTVDHSIRTCLGDVSENTDPPRKAKSMDGDFKELIVGQIKLFMFSGHDTTSASVYYSFYLLSKSPKDLDRVLAEHDPLFGTSLDRAAAMISEDAPILNQLVFTLAVIEETLRLFPITSSTRLGEPGFRWWRKMGDRTLQRNASYCQVPTQFNAR